MKKVCMLTSEESFLNNYGAALQGFALYQILRQNGFEPYIVRYDGAMIPRRNTLSVKRRMYLFFAEYYHKIFPTKIEKLIRKMNLKYSNEIKLRELHFKKFQDRNLIFNSDKRMNWFEIKENPPLADIYICGSDQIWNPFFHNGKNDLGYFLDFIENKPKIAYAPSFGCSKLPEPAKKDLKNLIEKFQSVSVREEAGKNIIFEYTGLDVPVVLDPTLLIMKDQWEKILNVPKNTPDRYILCYRFSDKSCFEQVVDRISLENSLPVIDIPLSIVSLNSKYDKYFAVGPEEFLGLIKNASLICTDSFHATVFSLIFNKPFYTFLRENFSMSDNNNMNSRVNNLLKIANLESRLIISDENVDYDKVFKLDFTDFEENLKRYREFSINWLLKSLEKASKYE